MMKSLKVLLVPALLLSSAAFAEKTAMVPAAAGQGAMDFNKMGPWTRKTSNEKQIKKDVNDFIAMCEKNASKGDFAAALANVDFPVFMTTDDQQGTVDSQAMNREQYTAIMKPFYEKMPKDMKVTHKPTITVLSDSLVNVTDDFTMTMGSQKLSGHNAGLLIKRDGQWKWKGMTEAGWGGMSPKRSASVDSPKL